MFRISVLLLLGLTFGVTAKPLKLLKPLKLWDEGSNAAVQKIWGAENEAVEPPEDMDQSSSDIEPGMKIWRSQRFVKAEGDLDHLHHPSTEQLLKALRETPPQEDAAAEKNLELELLEPEDDMDEVLHAEQVLQKYLAPLVAGHGAAPRVHRVHLEPEVQELQRRLHLEPEQDMDDIYHRDAPEMVLFQSEVRPAAAVDEVQEVQRRLHLEPERDEDDLYHADVSTGLMEEPEVQSEVQEVQRRLHLEPERDEDDLYHADVSTGLEEPEVQEVQQVQRRLHLEPEQDMDEVYHRDAPEMVLFQSEVRPQDEAWPTLRRHSEPEEDLDELYHQ